MKGWRLVANGFGQNLLGKILLKSFSFLSLPLLTYWITTEEMGIFQLLFGGLGIFIEIVALGTRQLFAIEYFKNNSMLYRLRLIAQNLLIYFTCSSFLFILLLGSLLYYLPSKYWVISSLAVLWSYLNMFNELYLSVVRFNLQFFRYYATSLSFGLLQLILILLFVLGMDLHLMGLVVSYILSEVLQGFWALYASRRELRIMRHIKQVNTALIRQVLSRSVVFIPSVLSYWLLMNIDQWMLGSMMGLESVGIYGLAIRFALLFDFFISYSFFTIYTPHLFERLRQNYQNGCEKNIKVALVVFLAALILCGLAMFCTPVLKWMIAPSYYSSIAFVAPLLFAAATRFACGILQIGLQYRNLIPFLLWTNVAAAMTNSLLNFFWIPRFGIAGCIAATNVSFCLMFALIWAKQYFVLYEKKSPSTA